MDDFEQLKVLPIEVKSGKDYTRHGAPQHTIANMLATAAKPLPPAYLSHIGFYFTSRHDLFTTTGGCVGVYVEGAYTRAGAAALRLISSYFTKSS